MLTISSVVVGQSHLLLTRISCFINYSGKTSVSNSKRKLVVDKYPFNYWKQLINVSTNNNANEKGSIMNRNGQIYEGNFKNNDRPQGAI